MRFVRAFVNLSIIMAAPLWLPPFIVFHAIKGDKQARSWVSAKKWIWEE